MIAVIAVVVMVVIIMLRKSKIIIIMIIVIYMIIYVEVLSLRCTYFLLVPSLSLYALFYSLSLVSVYASMPILLNKDRLSAAKSIGFMLIVKTFRRFSLLYSSTLLFNLNVKDLKRASLRIASNLALSFS